ncbi:tRNA (guanine26-N2/guanine27-N2)-dimethyltransferase, partial [Tremellales sp. Uapishka_1]
MTATQPPYTFPLPGGIPENHHPHTEGTTTILVPDENLAFLNPVQQYNRDLSVACIRAWNEMRKEELEAKWRARIEKVGKGKSKGKGKDKAKRTEEAMDVEQEEKPPVEPPVEAAAGPSKKRIYRAPQITILEALSATGLRSIRYAKEIPDVKFVLANDLSETACQAMKTNVAYNGVGEVSENSEGGNIEGGAVEDSEKQEDVEPFQAVEDTASAAPEEAALNGGEEATMDGEEEAALNGGRKAMMKSGEEAKGTGRRPGANGKVRVNEGDACTLMYDHRPLSKRVDVVDLDPYGTAAPFTDAAISCIADGGLLAVTCTDLAVLAGSQYPEKCFSNYGGVSVNAEYSHEVALRLVLNSLASAAARYGKYITPLLSFSIDFYVRLFVRIDTSPEAVKSLASNTGIVYCCNYCQSSTVQPFGRTFEKTNAKGTTVKTYKTAPGPPIGDSGCTECKSTLHLGGPMWIGPIQDSAFAERVLKGIEGQEADYATWTRMHGMLKMAQDELPDPFYFTCNKIFGAGHTSSAPSHKAISALLNAGYKVSRSHAIPGSIKTDAPRSFIYDIVRETIKTSPVRMDKIAQGSPCRNLISKKMTHAIDFTPHPDAKKMEKGEKVVFYQANPTANWGPGSRAKSAKVPVTAKKNYTPPAKLANKGLNGKAERAEPKAVGGEEPEKVDVEAVAALAGGGEKQEAEEVRPPATHGDGGEKRKAEEADLEGHGAKKAKVEAVVDEEEAINA